MKKSWAKTRMRTLEAEINQIDRKRLNRLVDQTLDDMVFVDDTAKNRETLKKLVANVRGVSYAEMWGDEQ